MYIGQSVDVKDRLAHHRSELRHNRHSNTYLQRSWNKYGEDAFIFQIMQKCDEDQLDYYEQKFIEEYDLMNRSKGFNRQSGGSANKHISVESRKKMSEAKKGRYDGAKNPMHGVHLKLSDERKRQLSIRFSGDRNPMYGVHLKLSDERKKQISERTRGVRNPFYGCKHSEETKIKMRAGHKNCKQVRCVEMGTIYRSLCEAERCTGCDNSHIAQCCIGKAHTCGGYHWEYVA